jgi:hypothetical protein
MELKEGWKTSEFWVIVLPIVGVFTLLLVGRVSVEQVVALWPVFAGSGSYAVSRGVAKLAK